MDRGSGTEGGCGSTQPAGSEFKYHSPIGTEALMVKVRLCPSFSITNSALSRDSLMPNPCNKRGQFRDVLALQASCSPLLPASCDSVESTRPMASCQPEEPTV